MGAHRNVFENNRILDNNTARQSGSAAEIVVQGPHHDLVFRGNVIGGSQPQERATVGILASDEANNLQATEDQFQHVQTAIEIRK
jgi:hypothetical protein